MISQIHFDMMNLAGGPEPALLYREALNIGEYLDQNMHVNAMVFSEHHLANYMTDPLGFANAMAARTSKCRIRIQSAVAANYDPMRLAEQAVQLDIISNGRLDLTLAWGYDPAERAMYPRTMKAPELMRELVALLRSAFAGKEFSWGARTGIIRQTPVQQNIPILIAGMAPAAVKRAAEIGDGFMAMMEESVPQYLAECEALGKPPGEIRTPQAYKFFHVSKDPATAWKNIRVHAQHDLDTYWQWMAHLGVPQQTAPETLAEAKASGDYMILTPEEAIEFLKPHEGFYTKPLIGGLHPDIAWESARLLAEEVFPEVENAEKSIPSVPGIAIV